MDAFACLHVNNDIIHELLWLASHVEWSLGLMFYKSLNFSPGSEEVVVAYTDASGVGLGLWFPDEDFACQCSLPNNCLTATIFWAEALAVCSVIHAIETMNEKPQRMLIYTDNSNVVAMFNSLHAHPPYNTILLSAIDVLLTHDVDL
jgi:hypothetical protein